MSDQDIKSLIAYRVDEAGEALRDAELLLDAGRHRSAANRLYYAAFYATLAVLLTKHLEYSRHSAVIASVTGSSFGRGFCRRSTHGPCIELSARGNKTTTCLSSNWTPTNSDNSLRMSQTWSMALPSTLENT